MKNKIHHLVLLLSLICSSVFSQVQYSRKYRITAYKSGNPLVFSLSNEVEVVPIMTIYVPNTFTPNGDGLNDSFGVFGEAIKDFSMIIFNRWGQKVFETENANIKWDGTYNGKISPQDSYTYVLSAQSPSGKKESKKGVFNLIQ